MSSKKRRSISSRMRIVELAREYKGDQDDKLEYLRKLGYVLSLKSLRQYQQEYVDYSTVTDPAKVFQLRKGDKDPRREFDRHLRSLVEGKETIDLNDVTRHMATTFIFKST